MINDIQYQLNYELIITLQIYPFHGLNSKIANSLL